MKSFFRGIFGGSTAPVDEEFDARVREFNQHAEKLRKVRLAMQLYLDAADAMSKAETILAEAFEGYYKASLDGCSSGGDARPPCHAVSESFRATMAGRFSVQRANINNIINNRCVKPVTAILAKVGTVHEKIKLRKTLLADHDSSVMLLQRAREAGKPQDDPSVQRHSIKLDEVSNNLGRVISSVDSSLEDFKQARPHMLAQEMAAVVGCIYYNGSSIVALVGKLLPLLPQSSSTLCVLSAMGSQKKRPSSLTTENLRAVEVRIARDSVMGGRYGGYGLLDSASGLLVPTAPLQSRESLGPSSSTGPGGKRQEVGERGVEEAEGEAQADLLDFSPSPTDASASTSAAPTSPTAMSAEEQEQQQQGGGGGGGGLSPRRSTHPTRPMSVRGGAPGSLSVHGGPSVPTIVPSLSAFGEDAEEDSEDEVAPTEHPQPHAGSRSSLVALRDLGRVKEQIAAQRTGAGGPTKPPKP